MHDSNDVVRSSEDAALYCDPLGWVLNDLRGQSAGRDHELKQLREQFGAALDATVKAGEVLARVNHDLARQGDKR